jgi:hypothetical protein
MPLSSAQDNGINTVNQPWTLAKILTLALVNGTMEAITQLNVTTTYEHLLSDACRDIDGDNVKWEPIPAKPGVDGEAEQCNRSESQTQLCLQLLKDNVGMSSSDVD